MFSKKISSASENNRLYSLLFNLHKDQIFFHLQVLLKLEKIKKEKEGKSKFVFRLKSFAKIISRTYNNRQYFLYPMKKTTLFSKRMWIDIEYIFFLITVCGKRMDWENIFLIFSSIIFNYRMAADGIIIEAKNFINKKLYLKKK